VDGLAFTVILAVIFTFLQVFEYRTAPFNISDGIYGSTFFMATGFHGIPRYNRYYVYSGLLIESSSFYYTTSHWL
jgi:heme/copper-type cytochrome/quinol oxidase subunit 3